ncbi:hypothetical protein RRG08_018532 [Elysia crispata]|uniref:Dynein axonemal light chain 1 n=1 Tax=Elysia crispata TaxID=231223 RepID=A0AAE0YDI2_9GAST|nr:hypothetical protein RRG08_018532 [Elysia crispata]
MAKGMTIKDALKQMEDDTGVKAKDAKVVKLIGKIPMIDKMDASLSQLEVCEQLSLSTNRIEKIANLNGLKKLTILSLGRNAIKSLAGVEALNDTLVQLWCSYNLIDKFKGVTAMKKLKVLHMAHNKVADIGEVAKLSSITTLEDVLLIGNPVEEAKSEEGVWLTEVKKKVPKLKKLDGIMLVGDTEEG